jgi:hypothetical protein
MDGMTTLGTPLEPAEPPGDRAPAASGAALRRTDRSLGLALGGAALVLACTGWAGLPPLFPGAARSLLGGAGALALLGIAPRATAAAIAGGAAALAPATVGGLAWAMVLALALLRLDLHRGAAGRWLAAVRRLERARVRALAATGLARSRAAGTAGRALTEAGDAYERAGRAQAELQALGADPAPGVRWVRPLAEALGRALSGVPRLRAWLERGLA